MAYVIEQKIKGHVYFYEVESYWDPEKKQARQKRKYLGKKDPETGESITPMRSNVARYTKTFGSVYILHQIAKEIGLEDLLLTHFGEDAKQILTWSYFKITESKASYLYREWCEDHFLPYEVAPLSSQEISRWFSSLERQDKQRTDFLCSWIKSNRHGKALWFDITSFSSYSENNTWCEWGYNRDGESLPQVNVGIVMSMLSGLPMFYQVYPGSISDVTTLKNIGHQAKSWAVELDTFVIDRGFYSASNLEQLKALALHFIMPLPSTVKLTQTLLAEVKTSLTSPLNSFLYQGQPLFAVRKSFELNGHVFYATIYFDEKRYADESNRFYRRLNELESHIENSELFSLQHATDTLEASWKGSSRYFNITTQAEGKVSLIRKRNAIAWRLNRMGRMILISDQVHEPDIMLDWYRNKDQLEKTFDTLKNELGEQRMRVHSAEKMQGKLFLNFIATILYSALQHRMKINKLHQKMSVVEIMLLLRKWRTIEFQNGTHRFTEISKKQRLALSALNIQIPDKPSY